MMVYSKSSYSSPARACLEDVKSSHTQELMKYQWSPTSQATLLHRSKTCIAANSKMFEGRETCSSVAE